MARQTREEKVREERPKRVPIAEQREQLAVQGIDTENYKYRWVNDIGVRIDQFKQAGYEPVEQDGSIMLGTGITQAMGSVVKAVVDRTTGQEAVLMRIRKEWYDEDQAKRDAEIDASEESMFRQLKEADGRYGKVTID